MAQIFHRSSNAIAKASIAGLVLALGGLVWLAYALNRSHYMTNVDVAREQPIQFSHAHHAGAIGIDCRYCHTSVEESAFAGIPPTKTCMTCHSVVWSDSPMLEPVRESFRTGKPIPWIRVHDLPDFVYFDHSIHVAKGVGCASCHGEVDQMPLTRKQESLHMEWCLQCHREPERFIRPRDKVTDIHWSADNQSELGPRLVEDYHVKKKTNCSVCHR